LGVKKLREIFGNAPDLSRLQIALADNMDGIAEVFTGDDDHTPTIAVVYHSTFGRIEQMTIEFARVSSSAAWREMLHRCALQSAWSAIYTYMQPILDELADILL
jgi:hypothetical protein